MGTDENTFKRVDWNHDGPLPSDDDDEFGLPVQPRGSGLSADDLELLTLAARAIGAIQVETVEGEQWVNLHMADGSIVYAWNPLMHSDDAFNLAVDLGMEFRVLLQKNFTVQTGDVTRIGVDHPQWTGNEPHGADARAATRRAVTRAAAEIGKTK